MMKPVHRKAVRLVNAGHVTVTTAEFNDDGALITATGTVQGDTGEYAVSITPDHTECGCTFGLARQDAAGHSHDIAVRLAAQQEEQ